MHAIICRYDIAYADETPVQVLKEKDRAASAKSMMWYFAGGAPTERCVIYEYHPTREGAVARDFFEGFTGFLHCDGYGGYQHLFADETITHVACWAHARRKFIELTKSSKHPPGTAVTLINLIKKLYELEKKFKEDNLTTDEIYTRRQTDAKPILLRIKAYLDEQSPKAPPQSGLAKAMNYTLNQWDALMTYITDGRLDIDNNASERGIKSFVIGRKNWLFYDQPTGAAAGAVIYSLIQTCKLHSVEPYAYFKYVLATIPYATIEEEFLALLPFNYIIATVPLAS
jgi:transposase